MIANEFSAATGDLHLSALVELGLVLFLLSLFVQLAAQWWLKRIKLGIGRGT